MYRLIIGILLGWSLSAGVVADVDQALADELEVLAHSKLSQMPAQIDVLAAIDDPRVAGCLPLQKSQCVGADNVKPCFAI